MLDLVGPPGVRRLCEDIPPDQLLTAADADAARAALTAANTVVLPLQLQQSLSAQSCSLWPPCSVPTPWKPITVRTSGDDIARGPARPAASSSDHGSAGWPWGCRAGEPAGLASR